MPLREGERGVLLNDSKADTAVLTTVCGHVETPGVNMRQFQEKPLAVGPNLYVIGLAPNLRGKVSQRKPNSVSEHLRSLNNP